jgi:hypothetical protein
MTDAIMLEKKDGSEEMMSVDEFSRWMCLVEAFHFIETKATELKLENTERLLKPLAIEQYITERFPSMRHDVGVEHRMGIV